MLNANSSPTGSLEDSTLYTMKVHRRSLEDFKNGFERQLLDFQRGRDSPIGNQERYHIHVFRNREPAAFDLPEVILYAGHVGVSVFLPVPL